MVTIVSGINPVLALLLCLWLLDRGGLLLVVGDRVPTLTSVTSGIMGLWTSKQSFCFDGGETTVGSISSLVDDIEA